jgi:sugar phosphate isomerase/epimerase
MPQTLKVFQSLWSMQRLRSEAVEPPLEHKVERIAGAGFAGLSGLWEDRTEARRMAALARAAGLGVEGACFPRSVDALKPVLDIAAETGLTHLNIQPNVRPPTVGEAVAILEGWMRLAEEVPFPVLIETHRARMTTDLPFTMALLEAVPDLPMLADLSHFVVGQEMELPLSPVNAQMLDRVLRNARAFHGRVASSEQVQVEIGFAQHQPWVALFRTLWTSGFRHWRAQAGADDALVFTCELGPYPYAISGADGRDLTDRWADSLALREMAEGAWTASGQ